MRKYFAEIVIGEKPLEVHGSPSLLVHGSPVLKALLFKGFK